MAIPNNETLLPLAGKNTGSFPTWLAPVQVAIIPVSQNYTEYGEKILKKLQDNDIIAELDKRNEKIGYKIRDWETNKVPYMLIIGEKEKEAGTVSVRKHKEGDLGSESPDVFISKILDEINNKK